MYGRAMAAAGGVRYRREQGEQGARFAFMGSRIKELTGYSAAEFTPDVLNSIIQQHEFRGPLTGLSHQAAVYQVQMGTVDAWTSDIQIITRSGPGGTSTPSDASAAAW